MSHEGSLNAVTPDGKKFTVRDDNAPHQIRLVTAERGSDRLLVKCTCGGLDERVDTSTVTWLAAAWSAYDNHITTDERNTK